MSNYCYSSIIGFWAFIVLTLDNPQGMDLIDALIYYLVK